MKYYFTIDFDASLIGEEFIPQQFKDMNLFSFSFTSHMYEDQNALVDDCNTNASILLSKFIKQQPNLVVRKYQNDGSDEFNDGEICKLIVIDSKYVDDGETQLTDITDILDVSPVTICIFDGEENNG